MKNIIACNDLTTKESREKIYQKFMSRGDKKDLKLFSNEI